MSTIIRAADYAAVPAEAFNLDDMARQAQTYLDRVRAEGEQIVAAARAEADEIRRQAQRDGRQDALRAVEEMVSKQLATALPAVRKAIEDLKHAKQAWLTHWEEAGVRVAAAIAQRVIRRELTSQPEITLTLLREALELAAGSPQLRIRVNGEDHQALGGQIETLVKELSGLASTEIVPDDEISRGGCLVETRFGTIDQQFEAQLQRIEEELT